MMSEKNFSPVGKRGVFFVAEQRLPFILGNQAAANRDVTFGDLSGGGGEADCHRSDSGAVNRRREPR